MDPAGRGATHVRKAGRACHSPARSSAHLVIDARYARISTEGCQWTRGVFWDRTGDTRTILLLDRCEDTVDTGPYELPMARRGVCRMVPRRDSSSQHREQGCSTLITPRYAQRHPETCVAQSKTDNEQKDKSFNSDYGLSQGSEGPSTLPRLSIQC